MIEWLREKLGLNTVRNLRREKKKWIHKANEACVDLRRKEERLQTLKEDYERLRDYVDKQDSQIQVLKKRKEHLKMYAEKQNENYQEVRNICEEMLVIMEKYKHQAKLEEKEKDLIKDVDSWKEKKTVELPDTPLI
jgi:Mg2+/Co2+ transporter CorB